MTQLALEFRTSVAPKLAPAIRAANYIKAAKSKDDKSIAVAIWAHFIREALR